MRAEIISHTLIYIGATVALIFTFTLPAPESSGGDVESYFFPQVMIVTIIILNTFSILSVIFKKLKSPEKNGIFSITKGNILRVVILITLMVSYIITLPIIGYAISTGLLLIGMMLIFGVKNYKILISIPIGVVGILYIVFDTLLSIPLP